MVGFPLTVTAVLKPSVLDESPGEELLLWLGEERPEVKALQALSGQEAVFLVTLTGGFEGLWLNGVPYSQLEQLVNEAAAALAACRAVWARRRRAKRGRPVSHPQ